MQVLAGNGGGQIGTVRAYRRWLQPFALPVALLCACLAAGTLGACSSAPSAWRPLWRAPYGYVPIPDRLELGRARNDLENENWELATTRLLALEQTHPEQLDIGFVLQDLRGELLARGLWEPTLETTQAPSIAGIEGIGDANPDSEANSEASPNKGSASGMLLDAEGKLSRYYAEQLTRSPSVPNLVLAARVQPDAEQAAAWLDQALALDPNCAWAHYGKAHALLRLRDQYRWRNARESLEKALALDPSHLAARRMEAWMLAQEGAAEPAAVALERWLIATEFDVRVAPESRVEARLDLARIWLATGAVDLALRELQSLEGEPVGRARRLLLMGVALTESGDVEGALNAVRQASMIPGVGVLPQVQEALLRGHWLQDREGAMDLWQEILTEAEKGSDPAVILQALRARVVLERGRAAEGEAEEEAAEESSGDPAAESAGQADPATADPQTAEPDKDPR